MILKLLLNDMNKKSTTIFHLRNDILFIAVLLFISAVGALYLFVFRGSGDTVKITVDGKLYGIYSLSQTVTEDISSGENGNQLNRLIIRDGKAYMETASCPDKICVAHRPIFRNGESIVCLPNRVVITVITDNNTDSPDIVA